MIKVIGYGLWARRRKSTQPAAVKAQPSPFNLSTFLARPAGSGLLAAAQLSEILQKTNKCYKTIIFGCLAIVTSPKELQKIRIGTNKFPTKNWFSQQQMTFFSSARQHVQLPAYRSS
jgi:hypothetical protein